MSHGVGGNYQPQEGQNSLLVGIFLQQRGDSTAGSDDLDCTLCENVVEPKAFTETGLGKSLLATLCIEAPLLVGLEEAVEAGGV